MKTLVLKKFTLILNIIVLSTGFSNAANAKQLSGELKLLQISLGQQLYFDKNLSRNRTQSCASCHAPEKGFIDPRDNGVNAAVSLGDDNHSLGDRTAPTASYAKFSPSFHYDAKKKQYIGGQFWDGRETDLTGQAGGPPTNPIEMGMPDKKSVVARLKDNNQYLEAFKKIYGDDIFVDNNEAYSAMAESIATFEKTNYFSSFDSKYDRSLKGKYVMNDQEELGQSLFFSNNNTNCAKCHKLKNEGDKHETFSNYQFHNIGVPINKQVRSKNGLADDYIDHGLLNNPKVADVQHDGKFKVPTLRNVAITAPYMHNGVFQELTTTILFYDKYNNKKTKINPETGKAWEKAEVEETINKKDLKMKKLNKVKVDALVAFLKTLTDKRYEHLIK